MSEQSPYAAPVPTPGVYPPPGVQMNPPAGFMPPPPAGYAPPPPVPAQAGQPASPYHSPAMTLTELSFAPLPVEAPPAPVAVTPPPPAGPQLVMDVLPSGGLARGISVGGGRTPLIALVLVLLLAGAGVFFGTDLLKSAEAPPPVVPAKTSAKPAATPLVGKTLTLNKANSGTLGGPYSVTSPTNWKAQQKVQVVGKANQDVLISHPSGQIFAVTTTVVSGEANGPMSAKELADFRTGMLSARKGATLKPGSVTTQVAGFTATGFDFTESGGRGTTRVVLFARNGTGYIVSWGAPSAEFAKSLTTFNRFLASVKFA